MAAALLGAPLLSASSASTVGLLGAGGVFAPTAGTLFSSLGTLSTVAKAAAGTATVASGIKQSQAAEAAADTNAAVAARNAEIARRRTQAETEQAKRERRLRLGANIARTGASGIGSEAVFDIFADNAAQEELNLMTIRNEGLLREQNFQTEASIQKQRAKNERGQRPLQVLGGVSSVASNVLSRSSV